MSHKFDSSFEDSNNIVAKLRRLKIQESLFLKTINKLIPKENESEVDLPILYSLEFKLFSKRLKDSFTEINIKFQDIKAEAEEKLSCLDIETMKKDVTKLDDKIRAFKNVIHMELTSMVSKTEQLNKAVYNTEENNTSCIMKPKTSKSKLFNHIVASPVKVLIKSPFKCKEVQDLQEFMMNSPNRYGGWNEYNHNIFVQIWQKHFGADVTRDIFEMDVKVCNIYNFEAFQKEALLKIAGSTKEYIIAHQKWYSKYLYLKEKQQIALNKWRRNQQLLTKTIDNKHHGYQNTIKRTKSFNTNTSQTVREVGDFLNTVKSNDTEEIASLPALSERPSLPRRMRRKKLGRNALRNMSFENEGLIFHSTDVNSVATNNFSGNTILEKKSYGGILKPTKQWTNRCNGIRDSVKTYNDIESIRKLGIPDWRLALQD